MSPSSRSKRPTMGRFLLGNPLYGVCTRGRATLVTQQTRCKTQHPSICYSTGNRLAHHPPHLGGRVSCNSKRFAPCEPMRCSAGLLKEMESGLCDCSEPTLGPAFSVRKEVLFFLPSPRGVRGRSLSQDFVRMKPLQRGEIRASATSASRSLPSLNGICYDLQ